MDKHSQFTLAEIINLEDYPINEADSVRLQTLVSALQSQLERDQYCVLNNFIRDAAINAAVTDVNAAMKQGYRNSSHRNCYLRRDPDPDLPEDHPSNIFFDAAYTMIAADLLPATFALKTLYYWQPMIDFVARVTGTSALYPSADPYQPVNVLCSSSGDESAWHFDSWNAFTMTLMLQPPQSGGEFELVPGIRSKAEPNHAALARVLNGDRSRVVTVPRDPGALVIFRGSTALHRVSPVQGNTARLMGVFVYEESPDVVGDSHVNATVYGPRAV